MDSTLFRYYSPYEWIDAGTQLKLQTHVTMRRQVWKKRNSTVSFVDKELLRRHDSNAKMYSFGSIATYAISIFVARRFGKLPRLSPKSWRYYPGLLCTMFLSSSMARANSIRSIMLAPGSILGTEMREIFDYESGIERNKYWVEEFERVIPQTFRREASIRKKTQKSILNGTIKYFFDEGIDILAHVYRFKMEGIEAPSMLIKFQMFSLTPLSKVAAMIVIRNRKSDVVMKEIDRLSPARRHVFNLILLRTKDTMSQLNISTVSSEKDEA